MNLVNIGKSSAKMGNAVESLAKTDDMLAVIGAVMLLGVVFSAYGAIWQGLLARKQYREQCSPNTPTENSSYGKTTLILTTGVIVGALLIYIIFKIKPKSPASV